MPTHGLGLDEETVVTEVAGQHDRLVTVERVPDAAGDLVLPVDGEEPVGVDAQHERHRLHP